MPYAPDTGRAAPSESSQPRHLRCRRVADSGLTPLSSATPTHLTRRHAMCDDLLQSSPVAHRTMFHITRCTRSSNP